MAGVKGRSGGPRKGAGGARPGAGRKPKAEAPKSANGKPAKTKNPVTVKLEGQAHGGALKRSKEKAVEIPDMDMLQLLQDVALGKVQASPTQVRAAIAAVQYTHQKLGEGGKKDAKQKQAEGVAGRFSPRKPPPLPASRVN